MSQYDFAAPRLFIESGASEGLDADRLVELGKPQHHYLCSVLRLSEGDAVLVFNGRDGEWLGRLTPAGRKQMALRLEAQTRTQPPPSDLHYLFAPLKHARLDYVVQKAVEMGAGTIAPVITRRTQVTRINLDRMRANAIEAAEQCGILALPAIAAPAPLATMLTTWDVERTLVFCDEDASIGDPASGLRGLMTDPARAGAKPIAVLIGPEGGFDEGERQMLLALPSVVRLSLGPRILRADTAGVAALALIQALVGDWTRTDRSKP